MKRALLAMLLLLAAPARAEDLVSGISQDIIQITSNYTGTNIVVFGAIEQAQNAQGRNIVVVVRGPDEPMTVRRRERIAAWRKGSGSWWLPTADGVSACNPMPYRASTCGGAMREIGSVEAR